MTLPLDDGLFQGFSALDVATANVRFSGVVGGSGPPLLLLQRLPGDPCGLARGRTDVRVGSHVASRPNVDRIRWIVRCL